MLADQLGFRDCYISEHRGEPPHIGKIDTIPVPELMMVKAATLTKHIRFGAAVKLIHLQHPLDIANQAAVTDHLIGDNRYIFGFGSGFPSPLFSVERGLTYEDRHARLAESLAFIVKAWAATEPFDWDGKYWKGKGIVALPKPLAAPHRPMATATDTEAMIELAGARGYTLLSAFLEAPHLLDKKAQKYEAAARAAGRAGGRELVTASRIVWVADSKKQAFDDMRAAVTHEVGVQAERGFLKMLKHVYNLDVPNGPTAIEHLAEAGMYFLGTPDEVAAQIKGFYEASGGFGTFLIVTGKNWADRERRLRSMRRFMEEVAPQLRHLAPVGAKAAVAG